MTRTAWIAVASLAAVTGLSSQANAQSPAVVIGSPGFGTSITFGQGGMTYDPGGVFPGPRTYWGVPGSIPPPDLSDPAVTLSERGDGSAYVYESTGRLVRADGSDTVRARRSPLYDPGWRTNAPRPGLAQARLTVPRGVTRQFPGENMPMATIPRGVTRPLPGLGTDNPAEARGVTRRDPVASQDAPGIPRGTTRPLPDAADFNPTIPRGVTRPLP
jgi:hypothetical protein